MRLALLLLFTFAFGVTNAFANPLSICRHADHAAHAAALHSDDLAISSVAQTEEAAAAAADKKGGVADAPVSAWAVVPESLGLAVMFCVRGVGWDSRQSDRLAGQTIAPLLDPPLS